MTETICQHYSDPRPSVLDASSFNNLIRDAMSFRRGEHQVRTPHYAHWVIPGVIFIRVQYFPGSCSRPNVHVPTHKYTWYRHTNAHTNTFTCMHPSVCTHQDVAEFHAQLLELLSVAFAMSSARTKSTPDPSPKPPKSPKVSKQMSEELIALTTELQVMVLLLTVDQRVFVGPEPSTNQPARDDCVGRNRTGRRRGDWAVARQDSGSGGNRGRGG